MKKKKFSREWFTSDQHFNHANCIEFSQRPFAHIEDMNESLIKNWNSYVCPQDTVFVVGDFAFKKSDREIHQLQNIIKRLNGRKVLIMGNHDHTKNHMYRCGFDVVVQNLTIKLGRNMECFVSHKPYRCSRLWKWWTEVSRGWKHKDWHSRPEKRNMIQIHGHTHSDKKLSETGICVCVEAWNYRPVNSLEIVQLIQKYNLIKKCTKL